MVRVELFRGGRIVCADGRTVERHGRRSTLLLLTYLALFQKRLHRRDELTETLWPDLNPASARNSLNVALSSLRSLFPRALHTDRQYVGLTVPTDVQELERTRDPDFYSGPLLAGFDLPWLNLERLRLESLALQLLEARGTEADWRRLLALDPTNETVLREVLNHLRAEGTPQERLRLYTRSVEALAELGLEPDEETNALVADLRRPGRAKRPAASTRNLPNWTEPFFGRQDDLERIEEAFSCGARMVTLTGPGGMGKTRLSVEFAHRCREHTACFVALASATTAEEMGEVVLQTLQMARDPAVTLWDQVAARLDRTATLLILDNFEQLPVEAALRIAQWLAAAPRLTCLVTSRRLLEIRGEHEIALDPLPPTYAVGLFMQRARMARADFAADPETVERIVLLLDRMPLALEMAAARALLLGAEEIVAALADRLAFLRVRRVDIEARHCSIEATLMWSWDLLTPELQATLAFLSLFQGGFTLKAAQAVCGGAATILDTLETLRANSLLAVSGELPRFHLLETIRVFARERLGAAARSLGCKRHMAYYTELLERGERCREERENLRAVATWCVERGDPEAHLRFIAAFRVQHWEEGFSESIDHCRPAAPLAADATLPPLLRGRALAAYALVMERVEQGSAEIFRRAAELLEEAGTDEPLRAFMLQYSGTQAFREQAEQVARQAGDAGNLAWILTIQGNHASYRGEWECAERYWAEALDVAVRGGETQRAAFVRCETSFYLVRRGEYVRAWALLQEISDFYRSGYWNYTRLLMALGRYDLARSVALRHVEHYEQLGASRLLRTAYIILAIAHLCVGDREAASRACAQAEKAVGTLQYRMRSEIALASGKTEVALRYARSGLALTAPYAQNFHAGHERVGLLEALAYAAARAGQREDAWSALREAMEVRFRSGVRQQQCENLEVAAYLQAQAGQFTAAAQSLRAAEEARLERSHPCPPYLRRFGTDARQSLPDALPAAPALSLDTAIQQLLT